MHSKNLTQFNNWDKLDTSILSGLPTDKGIYVMRLNRLISRLKGKSDILYFGQTKGTNGLKGRVGLYFRGHKSQATVHRLHSFIVGKYAGNIELAWLIVKEPRVIEKTLLQQYFQDHEELPPWNRIT